MHSKIAMLRAMETAEPASLAHEWWNVADQPRNMDAMSIAAIYNVIGLEGNKMVVPSVNTDSVKVMPAEASSETELHVARKYKEYLKTCIQDGGVGSRWMNKKVDISGNFSSHRNCRPTLYDDNIQDMERFYTKEAFDTYNQMIFVGYLPSDNPRYTICVTMDKEGMIGHVGLISNTVNKLTEYLNNDVTCHNGDNSMIGNRLHNAQ